MLKGRSMSHQISCVFQNGEDVRWEGQFLLARGSGPQASLVMRAFSHPASEKSIKFARQGKLWLRESYQKVTMRV
jgi:hypothetical protein